MSGVELKEGEWMKKQCKSCIHSEVCSYKEHYEDAVELYEKARNECSKYPFFVCDIKCIKYNKAEGKCEKWVNLAEELIPIMDEEEGD